MDEQTPSVEELHGEMLLIDEKRKQLELVYRKYAKQYEDTLKKLHARPVGNRVVEEPPQTPTKKLRPRRVFTPSWLLIWFSVLLSVSSFLFTVAMPVVGGVTNVPLYVAVLVILAAFMLGGIVLITLGLAVYAAFFRRVEVQQLPQMLTTPIAPWDAAHIRPGDTLEDGVPISNREKAIISEDFGLRDQENEFLTKLRDGTVEQMRPSQVPY